MDNREARSAPLKLRVKWWEGDGRVLSGVVVGVQRQRKRVTAICCLFAGTPCGLRGEGVGLTKGEEGMVSSGEGEGWILDEG